MPSIMHTLRITQNIILVLLLLCLSLSLQAEEKGEWIKDSETGCAVWNEKPVPNETIIWSGGCIDGKATGKGVLQWYKDGKPGDRYEGEYKNGKMYGHGIYSWSSGSRYEGEYKDNKKHGHGVHSWSDGERYEGEYKNGKHHGHGIYSWPDGSRYEGEYNEGKKHGHGVFTKADGTALKEVWEYGQPKTLAKDGSENFDFLLVVTKQNAEMDWWYAVPSQFIPTISLVSKAVKGEYFRVFPIFGRYGVTPANEVHVTYDVEIRNPDGTVYDSQKNLTGFRGPPPGFYLLPSQSKTAVAFDSKSAYGEYTISITAFDHIKKQRVNKSEKVTLNKFRIKEPTKRLGKWAIDYPIHPKPSYALSAFVDRSMPYLDKGGRPLWNTLWFFKHIYSENSFLIPHTVEFYKTKATKEQRKNIILLFYLLDRIGMLTIDDELSEYAKGLEQLDIPDPYHKITSGAQLDMLWGEFFATSRIKPVRQILTALNLGIYFGTIDKVESGKLDKSPEVLEQAFLEAVFRSAVWSINSNLRQSRLLFQYCVSLYNSGDLNEVEKDNLGAMLGQVSAEKREAIQPDTETER